jgi:putative hydrolase of the HAD superfamily
MPRPTSENRLEGLIFDFDGLILDTETPEVEGWRETFAEYRVEFPEAYFLWAVGRGAEQITERPIDFFRRALPDADHEEIASQATARRLAGIYANPPRPGLIALLDDAASNGLALAVASSSRHAWVDAHLDRLGLRDRFQHVVCADDVERAKPFPDLYLRALELLQLSTNQVLALEDSLNGATAAHAAGLGVIHVPNALTQVQLVPFALARHEDFHPLTIEGMRSLLILQNE